MSRPFLTVASTVLVSCVLAASAAAQTVDELVAKNLQARGGLEKIKAAQTLKMVAHLNSQGMDLPMTLYAKRPNMTRKELTLGAQKILFVFDGTTAWQINPLQASADPIVVSGPELEVIKQESDFDNPFVDYQARGYTITSVGTETIAGRSLHHLKLTKNGLTQDCYLDAMTGLEAKTVNQSPMGALEQEFSDYRDVQGLKLPFMVRTLQNGVRVAEIRIDTIEVNAPIDEALFKKPSK
jgi:outer membrane lipoprotein-sorting protein